jgi:hypothetical protein
LSWTVEREVKDGAGARRDWHAGHAIDKAEPT